MGRRDHRPGASATAPVAAPSDGPGALLLDSEGKVATVPPAAGDEQGEPIQGTLEAMDGLPGPAEQLNDDLPPVDSVGDDSRPPPTTEDEVVDGMQVEETEEPAEPTLDAIDEPSDDEVLDERPELHDDPAAVPGDDSRPPPTNLVTMTKVTKSGHVLCKVIGPGDVKYDGRWYPQGSIAEFEKRDADTMPQLERV